MFHAEFLDDLGARSRLVPKRATADAPLELIHDFARKAVRIERKGFLEMDTGHFPVARGCVFTRRRQRTSAEGGRGRLRRLEPRERLDIRQTEPAQVRKPER